MRLNTKRNAPKELYTDSNETQHEKKAPKELYTNSNEIHNEK